MVSGLELPQLGNGNGERLRRNRLKYLRLNKTTARRDQAPTSLRVWRKVRSMSGNGVCPEQSMDNEPQDSRRIARVIASLTACVRAAQPHCAEQALNFYPSSEMRHRGTRAKG